VGGDIILEVEGIRIENQESFTRIHERLSRKKAGDAMVLKILREGRVVRALRRQALAGG
jgi:S1-C subfamily serine protease